MKQTKQWESFYATLAASERIVITSHKSPDGDSIGSSVALYFFLKELGKEVRICHPDKAASYLTWLEGTAEIVTYDTDEAQVIELLHSADVLFSLDYNAIDRLGEEMAAHFAAAKGKKVMIDHHLKPTMEHYDFVYSDSSIASTSELIYDFIRQAPYGIPLRKSSATALYLGTMTDTGSFRFPSVRPETHLMLAELLRLGVEHHTIHEHIFDNNTLDRLRLRGFACSEKLELLSPAPVVVLGLTQEELHRFNYVKGDTEGLVNVALSIEGMKIAAFFQEAEGYIKISFRSKGTDYPVNELSAKYFQGGGHRNAAGGRFDGNLSDAITLFKQVIHEYLPA